MIENTLLNLYQTIVKKIHSSRKYEKGELITFLNPYSYFIARKSIETFTQFDRVYIDGMLLVKLLRLFGVPDLSRNSFDYTSMGRTVLEDLNNSQDSVYIIGTTENSVKKAVSNFLDLYPSINLIGYRNGYFKNEDELNLVIDKIVSLNPSFVIVGMGTPNQENFLIKLREAGWIGTGFTCGGFLHQSAKNVVYYPKWINLLNLRWIYRVWDEPKLIKRYFFWYPISVVVLLKDILMK